MLFPPAPAGAMQEGVAMKRLHEPEERVSGNSLVNAISSTG